MEESFASGYTDEKTALALHYLAGAGVEKDPEHGLELLIEAASAGSTDAQVLLAMYGISSGSTPDAVLPAGDVDAESSPEITKKEQIKSAQEMLNQLGYDCGTPDGVAGKKTQAAVAQFQRDSGLTETGTINAETLAKLEETLA